MTDLFLQAGFFLLKSLAQFLSILLLMRFFMQLFRVSFNNQVGTFVVQLTNWLVLPFLYSRASGENWIRHNIEETGRTEDIAPVLYARAQAEQATQRG